LIAKLTRAGCGALLLATSVPASLAQGFPLQERASFALAAASAATPGQTVRLSATITIESGWHTNSHRPTYDI
jgi:DsbC/DsbD-like thiol-disulfide interchange protein